MSGYNPSVTIGKGGKQLINVLTSTAFSSALVVGINALVGKEVEAETIQEGIGHISGSVLFLTPVFSAIIRMITNWYKNRKRRI